MQDNPEIFFGRIYDNKNRFISYWHQVDEIMKMHPRRTLEIGIGNGFVSNYLRKRNLHLVTMDKEAKLIPDVLADITSIPFESASFDLIACYELLEHLPYDNFNLALLELFRVSSSRVVLSLPDAGGVFSIYLRFLNFFAIKKLISCPGFKIPEQNQQGKHYWEIGRGGWPLKKILKDIHRAGFIIESTYRIFEFPYHRFFILKK